MEQKNADVFMEEFISSNKTPAFYLMGYFISVIQQLFLEFDT